jgi:hypothetical protein
MLYRSLRDLLNVHKDFSHAQLVRCDAVPQLLYLKVCARGREQAMQDGQDNAGKAGKAGKSYKASKGRAEAEQRQSKSRAKAEQKQGKIR